MNCAFSSAISTASILSVIIFSAGCSDLGFGEEQTGAEIQKQKRIERAAQAYEESKSMAGYSASEVERVTEKQGNVLRPFVHQLGYYKGQGQVNYGELDSIARKAIREHEGTLLGQKATPRIATLMLRGPVPKEGSVEDMLFYVRKQVENQRASSKLQLWILEKAAKERPRKARKLARQAYTLHQGKMHYLRNTAMGKIQRMFSSVAPAKIQKRLNKGIRQNELSQKQQRRFQQLIGQR